MFSWTSWTMNPLMTRWMKKCCRPLDQQLHLVLNCERLKWDVSTKQFCFFMMSSYLLIHTLTVSLHWVCLRGASAELPKDYVRLKHWLVTLYIYIYNNKSQNKWFRTLVVRIWTRAIHHIQAFVLSESFLCLIMFVQST